MSVTESQSDLPTTPLMNALSKGPVMNVNNNIIAGPGPNVYWNHSPGLQRPMVREEQGFPIYGNIGSLVKQEADNQFQSCGFVGSGGLPKISGSPNCTSTFSSDIYTLRNTCPDQCAVKYPESYGGKDFGYPEGMPKISNSHQIHAMQNIRASVEGQGPANNLGCYEFIPRISTSQGHNTCALNQRKIYSQVGQWNLLPQYSNIQYSNFPTPMPKPTQSSTTEPDMTNHATGTS